METAYVRLTDISVQASRRHVTRRTDDKNRDFFFQQTAHFISPAFISCSERIRFLFYFSFLPETIFLLSFCTTIFSLSFFLSFFVCLSFFLSLSICLFVSLSLSALCLSFSASLPVLSLSVSVFLSLSLSLSACLSICLSLSACRSVSLSLSVSLFISFSLYPCDLFQLLVQNISADFLVHLTLVELRKLWNYSFRSLPSPVILNKYPLSLIYNDS